MELPLYIKIHNALKEFIESEKWSIGERIPSERLLAESFNVSRMTIRQAIKTLVEEGVLERHVGSGTYVAKSRVQEKMSGVTSFTELMRQQGKEPSSKTVSYIETSPSMSESEKLKISPSSRVLRMERIRFADLIPICFEVATIPCDLVKEYKKEQITDSLYKTVKENGLNIEKAQQTVSATVASERIADFLDIKRGAAILKLRQITFLDSKRPFEYVRTQYAGERFEFYLEK